MPTVNYLRIIHCEYDAKTINYDSMEVKTIGEYPHTRNQLSLSHWLWTWHGKRNEGHREDYRSDRTWRKPHMKVYLYNNKVNQTTKNDKVHYNIDATYAINAIEYLHGCHYIVF